LPLTPRAKSQHTAKSEIDRKIDALAHHASQFHDFAETAKWLRRRAEELGERTGYRAAEAAPLLCAAPTMRGRSSSASICPKPMFSDAAM